MGRIAGFLFLLWAIAHVFTNNSQIARAIAWLDSDVGDYQRFPKREVANAAPGFDFQTPSSEQAESFEKDLDNLGLSFGLGGEAETFKEFLERTNTTSFLIIKDDVLLFEGYYNGYDRESTVTSFSVAKSFVSALVGIAIDKGAIENLYDPVTKYVPELLETDPNYAQISLRHLVSMSSGIRYEEYGLPWSDDAATYYSPNLRALAISSPIVKPPGEEFLYNNFHPLLLGLVLERSTGMSVAGYLEKTIWQEIGMEAPGSWSLDSESDGFEKMESGINGRAIDFAKFGRLFLHGGNWDGKQLISSEWVKESTALDSSTDPARDYQYFWWVNDHVEGAHHYYAAGKHGQYIYLVPEERLIIVRFGRTDLYREWVGLFEQITELTKEFE